jgi:hypothetical protein
LASGRQHITKPGRYPKQKSRLGPAQAEEGPMTLLICVKQRRFFSETADFSTLNILRRALSCSSAVARVAPLPVQFEGEDPLRFREISSSSRSSTTPEIF